MPLLVDTFNVLHQTGVLPPSLAGIDVAGLIDLVLASRYKRHRTRLVCDGSSKYAEDVGDIGNVSIEFSGHGRTADDVITHHIKRTHSPRQLIVVTSDREIQKAARRRRCEIVSSPAFLRQLASDFEKYERTRAVAPPPRPQEFIKPLSERATAKWMRELGVDDAEELLGKAQRDAIDEEVNKLLGEQRAKDEKLEKKDTKLSRDEERAERAARREKKLLDRAHRDHGPPLPMDLLAEAERLWLEEQSRDATS